MRSSTVAASLLALAAGGLPILHGLGFMATFNTAPLPALVELAERPDPVARPTSSRSRVVVVVVDGLRADFAPALGLTPGTLPHASCQIEALLPSFSRPGYVALSTGVPPWASGVHTNDHEGAVALPSIWSAARRAGVTTHLVADGTDWWIELFPEAFDEIAIVAKDDFDAFWSGFSLDPAPSLLLVHLVAADDAAHDFGIGDAYRAELARAGRRIQSLIDALDPAHDTLIVTADHGHIARGGHGGPEPEVIAIPFLAYGAGVTAHPDPSDQRPWCGSLLDLPTSIAARLDLAPPAAAMGSLVPLIRPVSPTFNALLAARTVALHDALGPHAGAHPPSHPLAPIAHGRQEPLSVPGLGLALGLWFGLVIVLLPLLVPGPRARTLLSALTPPLVFAVAYAIFEPTLSLSAVWLEDPWKLRMIAIIAGAALVSTLFVFRRHAPFEALAIVAAGATLPVLLAAFAHGSLDASPVLGDPHAAFALIVADLFAGVTLAVAACAAIVSFLRERRRAHAKVWVD